MNTAIGPIGLVAVCSSGGARAPSIVEAVVGEGGETHSVYSSPISLSISSLGIRIGPFGLPRVWVGSDHSLDLGGVFGDLCVLRSRGRVDGEERHAGDVGEEVVHLHGASDGFDRREELVADLFNVRIDDAVLEARLAGARGQPRPRAVLFVLHLV